MALEKARMSSWGKGYCPKPRVVGVSVHWPFFAQPLGICNGFSGTLFPLSLALFTPPLGYFLTLPCMRDFFSSLNNQSNTDHEKSPTHAAPGKDYI